MSVASVLSKISEKPKGNFKPKSDTTDKPSKTDDVPFCPLTYKATMRWITMATLKIVAGLSKESTSFPTSMALDNVLEANPVLPNVWVTPTVGKFAPLRQAEDGERIPNYKGRRNAFFLAVKKWRPPQELAMIGLDIKYKASYVLDRENGNRYVHTVIHLGEEGYIPGVMAKSKLDKATKKPMTQFKPKPKFNPKAKADKATSDDIIE